MQGIYRYVRNIVGDCWIVEEHEWFRGVQKVQFRVNHKGIYSAPLRTEEDAVKLASVINEEQE